MIISVQIFWNGRGPVGSAVGGAYYNWGNKWQGTPSEPDNFADQDAAGIALADWFVGPRKAGEWNDININNQLYYVIEYDAVAPTADFSASPTQVCAADSITFTDLSLDEPTSWMWTFPGGTPDTSASQHPIVVYNTPGTYDVKLVVSNIAGSDSITMTNYITVNPVPVADAGVDSAICKGSSLTLSATGGVDYSWEPSTGLDDPNIANPVATPMITTTYIVTVTNGSGCSDTDSVTITVSPGANTTSSDSAICIGSSANLFASGGVSYSWSPSTGLNDTAIANPVASPTADITYTVTVIDEDGCSDADSLSIIVNSLPTANATSSDTAVCLGSGTNLLATGGVGYNWSPSAGLNDAAIANPVASPVVTTTYSVTVTDGNGCSDEDSVNITVHELPAADAGSDTTICKGTNTDLLASGGVNYSWSPTTGLDNPDIANPVASPVITTTYIVTVTDTNGCTDTDSVTVTVHPIVNATSSDSAICIGTSTNLLASGGVTYSWTPTTGLDDPDAANPVASPTATTTYTVTVIDEDGCTDTDSITITVNELPTADAGSDTAICAGSSANLSATGGINYSWIPSIGLNNPNIANPVASPTTTTTYTVEVTDINECSDTSKVTITVYPLPSVSLNGLDSSYCTTHPAVTLNGSPTGGTFSGPGISGNQFNPSNAGVGTHTITYTYTDGNNCTNSSSESVVIDVCDRINEVSFIKEVSLFPNPSTGKFILELFQTEQKDLTINIINILGQEVFSKTLKHFKGNFKQEVDLSEYKRGVYLLKIQSGKNVMNKKIIIEYSE